MPNLGESLDHHFTLRDNKFNKASVYHMGLVLLNALEQIHSTGYVYNDLKPDNIVVGQIRNPTCLDSSIFKLGQVYLIDYGLATKYICKESQLDGFRLKHIE